jgi:hypothetical protein
MTGEVEFKFLEGSDTVDLDDMTPVKLYDQIKPSPVKKKKNYFLFFYFYFFYNLYF